VGVGAVVVVVGDGGNGVVRGFGPVLAAGLMIVPSRYPDTLRNSEAIRIIPLHDTQLVPLNFAVSAKMGGAFPPVFVDIAVC
jgi:hypothetical protein